MTLKRAIRSAFVIVLSIFAQEGLGQSKAPDVKLSLLSNVAEVAPGQPFELALKFEFPSGFHLYWENPGDSGLAPQVKWNLPEGFAAGPLQFPAPKTHKASGLTTYVLEGSPILLTTVTPSKDANVGGTVKIDADVSWLICKESCFRGSESVSIALSIAAQAKPVEDDIVFKLARRSLPVAANKASYISIKPSVSKPSVSKGDSFEVILDVDIKDGYHTQSNAPLGEFFVATSVYPRIATGMSFGEPAWPEPHIRDDKVLGKISEFEDAFKVRVPVKLESKTASADVQLTGLLKYQACDEKGRCHTPQAVEWAVNVKSESVVAGAQDAAVNGNGAAAEPAVVAQVDANDDKPSDRPDSGDPKLDGPTSDASEPKGVAATTNVAKPVDNGWMSRWGIWGAILGGMIGGLILNIMPCVLPVISIKILSFVQQADEDPKRVFHLGLMFCAGIIVSFWALAAGILAIRAGSDSSAGWGAFFQESKFIISMCALMFAFALSLFGVFEISLPGSASTSLSGATEREGLTGAFMKGVLATLLATPCTAPFLGPAIFFALTSSVFVVAIVFTAVGVGMALPYFLLTARPGWLKYLPRPGAWMNTFKQLMGFLLMGTVVWLVWLYANTSTSDDLVMLLLFLVLLAVACWLYGIINPMWSVPRKTVVGILSLSVFGFGIWYSFLYVPPQLEWREYAKGRAQQLSEDGYTVYVDYTARYCTTCLANKKLVLHSEPIRRRFYLDGTIPIKADFSDESPDIAADLASFGVSGVPLNVIYPAGRPNEPIVLPTILTKNVVIDALKQAGPSQSSEPLPDDVVAAVKR